MLLGFPKIGDVAVFAVPHDEWGEGVMEAVEPQEGVGGSPELAEETPPISRDTP